jgi:RNA-directed DNA polymerase
MQLDLFENAVKPQIELHELYEAYIACRKNKRNTIHALAFELDYESKLMNLWKQINKPSYEISRSIAFMIQKPVQREIFAAAYVADNKSLVLNRFYMLNFTYTLRNFRPAKPKR